MGTSLRKQPRKTLIPWQLCYCSILRSGIYFDSSIGLGVGLATERGYIGSQN